MSKLLIIYDEEGKIYHWSAGSDIKEPKGIPHIILEDYEADGRNIERIDVTKNPPVPVYSKTKEEIEYELMTLEDYQNLRQTENKKRLEEFLKNNPICWTDGLYYGVTQEDQNEMNLDLSTYQLKQTIGDTAWKLQWHSIKSDCRNFSEEEFVGLLNSIIEFVYPYRQLEMKYKEAIFTAKSKEEVREIDLTYNLGVTFLNE